MQIEKATRILNRNRKERLTTKEVEEIKAFLENYSKIIIHNMLNEN
jgi:DNA-binding winged helix-turn-helix (wHTH) protein